VTFWSVWFDCFLDSGNLREFLLTKRKWFVSNPLVSSFFNYALSYKLGIVNLRSRFLDFANFLIHMRLSEFRFVKLIMTVSTITNNINENIFMELLSVFYWEFANSVDSFWIISIYMNNRGIKCFSYITAVKRASSINRIRRETNLIIDNHMDSTSYWKLRNFSKCKRLIHYTLRRERCITVKLNIQYLFFTLSVNFSMCFTHANRVDEFEMGRVVKKWNIDWFSFATSSREKFGFFGHCNMWNCIIDIIMQFCR